MSDASAASELAGGEGAILDTGDPNWRDRYPDRTRRSAAPRCGEVADPGADYPHPCTLPQGHEGPHDGRSGEQRRVDDARAAAQRSTSEPIIRQPNVCPNCNGQWFDRHFCPHMPWGRPLRGRSSSRSRK